MDQAFATLDSRLIDKITVKLGEDFDAASSAQERTDIGNAIGNLLQAKALIAASYTRASERSNAGGSAAFYDHKLHG